jgi:hypothetical protein
LFHEQTLLTPNLPPGPTMYLLERSAKIPRTLFAPSAPDVRVHPTIFVLPHDTPDPARPAALLSERYSGRRMTLPEFVEAVRA